MPESHSGSWARFADVPELKKDEARAKKVKEGRLLPGMTSELAATPV